MITRDIKVGGCWLSRVVVSGCCFYLVVSKLDINLSHAYDDFLSTLEELLVNS